MSETKIKNKKDRLLKLLKDYDTTVYEQNKTLESNFNDYLKQFERAHKLQLQNIPKKKLNLPFIEYLNLCSKEKTVINKDEPTSPSLTKKYHLRIRNAKQSTPISNNVAKFPSKKIQTKKFEIPYSISRALKTIKSWNAPEDKKKQIEKLIIELENILS